MDQAIIWIKYNFNNYLDKNIIWIKTQLTVIEVEENTFVTEKDIRKGWSIFSTPEGEANIIIINC